MPVQKVGAYDIFGTIGKGTFCKVKFAMNRDTNSSVAVKILDKVKLRDANLLEATKNEIGIMKKLDHFHVCVGVHDMFANPDKIIVVIDLVMGVSLLQVFKSKKRINEGRAKYYLTQVLEGIKHIHAHNIVCGGLELESILVEADHTLKISDFGRAVFFPPATTTASSSAQQPTNTLPPNPPANFDYPLTRKRLTLAYRTPEQCCFEEVGGSNDTKPLSSYTYTDVWTVGILLYALLANRLPFEPQQPTQAAQQSQSPQSVAAAVASSLRHKIRTVEHAPYPPHFSADVTDLLSSIFVSVPASRATIADIESCAWIHTFSPEEDDNNNAAGATDDHTISNHGNHNTNHLGLTPNPFDTPVAEDNSPLCAVLVPGVLYVPSITGIASMLGSLVFGGSGSTDSQDTPTRTAATTSPSSTSHPTPPRHKQPPQHQQKQQQTHQQYHRHDHGGEDGDDLDSDFDDMGNEQVQTSNVVLP